MEYSDTAFRWFKERLQLKLDHPKERAALYVALGDSVTEGGMESGRLETSMVYHQLFKKKVEQQFPNQFLNVINSGVSGDTAVQSRSRWHRDVLQFQPDLVTIMFGLNDAHGKEDGITPFTEAIIELVTLIRETTKADILLITPGMMMVRDNNNISSEQREVIPAFLELAKGNYLQKYVESLRKLAVKYHIPLLDVYAIWEEMQEKGIDIHDLLANGINHPNPIMHERIASAMKQCIFS